MRIQGDRDNLTEGKDHTGNRNVKGKLGARNIIPRRERGSRLAMLSEKGRRRNTIYQ